MTTIFTIVDRFSKACHLVPLRKLPSALQTAQLLVKHVFRLHGIPLEILSDRGPQFTAQVWKHFCAALEAKVCLTSGYHPQSNGQTERIHNSLTSSATGLSPFEVSLGYQTPLFPLDEKEISVTSVQHHIRRCKTIWSNTVAALNRTAEQNCRFADRKRRPAPRYTPGQQVWLSTRDIPLKSMSRKLSPRFIGPYEIEFIISSSAVRLHLPPSLQIHPTFHVSQIKPVFTSPLCPPPEPPPPAREFGGGPVYSVRRIVDSRKRGRGWQYLVDWEGYGPEDRQWVPGSFIVVPSLITDYHFSLPSCSVRPPGGGRWGGTVGVQGFGMVGPLSHFYPPEGVLRFCLEGWSTAPDPAHLVLISSAPILGGSRRHFTARVSPMFGTSGPRVIFSVLTLSRKILLVTL
uniref:Integrase catalytic domain-containing protein n=1 Tax=Kryptolebias marmoratus TaxID=37003 RepID=A0A3Q3A6F2_KRYMA